jgi:hypothetical protein
MPKLRLEIDDLQVVSFVVEPAFPRGKGTVQGRQVWEKEFLDPEPPTGGTLGTTDVLTTVNATLYPQVTCAGTCVGSCDATCAATCYDTCANSCVGTCGWSCMQAGEMCA